MLHVGGLYTPADQRRFGYYTLPILWRDSLVARFDSRFDRTSETLSLNGLWLEEDALASDGAFVEALGRGMTRFRAFLGAERLDTAAVAAPLLRPLIRRMETSARVETIDG